MCFCAVYHGTEGPVVVDDMASTLLADKLFSDVFLCSLPWH